MPRPVLIASIACSLIPLALPGQATTADTVTAGRTRVDSSGFNLAGLVSVLQLLQNAVPGLQVTPGNQPGGAYTLRIRGATSVNAPSDPLIVVDGMPLAPGGGLSVGSDPLEFLDPGDIESITVVKDGTAAAYGRGSNGVILITTKLGSGAPHVEYGGSFSLASVTRVPPVLDAAQFRAAVTTFDTAGITKLGNATTDWFDQVDRTANGATHRISLAAGDPSRAYRLSAGFTDLGGAVGGSSTRRISAGADFRQRLFQDRLNVQANLRGARLTDAFTPAGVLQNAAEMGPTQPVTDDTTATGYANWPGSALTSADNPVEIQRLANDQATTDRGLANLALTYDFSSLQLLRGLSAGVTLGYDVGQATRVALYPNDIHYETKSGTDGMFARLQLHDWSSLVDASLGYAPPLAPSVGRLDVTVGYSWWRQLARQSTITLFQLTSNIPGPNGLPPSNGPPVSVTNSADPGGLTSAYGRAGYSVADRYFLTASVRRDGSTRFPRDHQWQTFPAFSAGWRVTAEPADLLLRASWGKTGNQELGTALPSSFSPCGPGGTCFLIDPNLTWETSRTWNLGADVGLPGRRVTGSVDWHDKRTDHLLLVVPSLSLPPLPVFVLTNVGGIRNTGVELGLKAALVVPQSTDGFSWTATLNAAHNANTFLGFEQGGGGEVLTGTIAGGVGSTIQVLEPGHALNSFLVCRQVYSGGKPVEGHYLTLAGVDTTACALGTNTVAEHDPAPHWIFGLTSRVAFHRFDASVSVRAWLGNYVYNNAASALGDYGELSNGAFPFNLSRSVLATGFMTQQLRSDYYLENGSFLRLDDVMVGYTFPWLGEELRAFVDVRNALTITGYRGMDPAAADGIDDGGYPLARVVTGGLTVRF